MYPTDPEQTAICISIVSVKHADLAYLTVTKPSTWKQPQIYRNTFKFWFPASDFKMQLVPTLLLICIWVL